MHTSHCILETSLLMAMLENGLVLFLLLPVTLELWFLWLNLKHLFRSEYAALQTIECLLCSQASITHQIFYTLFVCAKAEPNIGIYRDCIPTWGNVTAGVWTNSSGFTDVVISWDEPADTKDVFAGLGGSWNMFVGWRGSWLEGSGETSTLPPEPCVCFQSYMTLH